MFASVYQNGEYGIEIFAPSGNEPFKMCKLNNEANIKKVYDRSIKGYMAALEKESSTTFLQIPRSSKSSLGITQPLLVFQIQLHPEKSFTLELILLDSERQKRRFHLSTKFKEVDANNLHVSIPWVQPDREQWTNVAINLMDLIQSFSPPGSDVVYFGLESFSIQPVCRLRKIFSLPLKYLGDEDTGLLIPPKYDFTSGVEANSWVFNYAPPQAVAHAKTAGQKDLEAAHKTSKIPTKTEGAKEGDLMGIVGKKVPRQEANTSAAPTATAPGKKSAIAADAKSDQQLGTMHWAAEESALKRQKAATGAGSTTATPVAPARNPWADSPAPGPGPVNANAKSNATHSAAGKTLTSTAAREADSKRDTAEFKIHSAKFTDEEEEEDEAEQREQVAPREEPMDVEAEPLKDSTPAVPQSAPQPVPPVALPSGGIKFSSKLKQKLGASTGVPLPSTVPVSVPISPPVVEVQETLTPATFACAENSVLDSIPAESTEAAALVVPETESVSAHQVVPGVRRSIEGEEESNKSQEEEEIAHPAAHALPPASPVLPTPSIGQKAPVSRMSTDDESSLALASQDFSAIDDFVKNYTTQQGALQGYASFARVDSEVATQLNSKQASLTPNDETNSKSMVGNNDGIASASDQRDDRFAQIKQHERTPSRAKKFADVALSPMPVSMAVSVVTVQQQESEPMSGIAEGNDGEEEVDIGNEAAETEAADLTEPMEVSARSRPHTAHVQTSRPSTASRIPDTVSSSSRPNTGTGTLHPSLPTPPPTSLYPSRPPTAPEVSGSMSSPVRQSTPHGASTSRPGTGTARLSSSAVEAALLSPFSDAIAYFEQSKKSRDFSSSLRNSAVQGSDVENRQNSEPNVTSSTQIDETQSYFDVYQQRSSGIAQQWTEDVDNLLDRLSHSSRPATATASVAPSGTENTSFASMLAPANLTTPLPERKKRAIRSRVASLLRQVEQAEMEYIAEFGFEAFEQEVGFFEDKTKGRWV